MGNRRFTQMAPSDDEDDGPPPPPPPRRRSSANGDEEKTNQRKRKKMKLVDEEEDEEKQVKEDSVRNRKKQKEVIEEEEATAAEPSGDEEEVPQEEAKPIGDVIRASGKGRGRRNHYEAFEYDGMRYDLMTDARYKRCKEKKVVLIDTIQTGHGDRYQKRQNGIVAMGKKKSFSTAAAGAISARPHLQQAPSGTMREESRGKKQSNVNPKSMLKLDHLKNLAIWATAEASVSSLVSFFGHRLATTAEALGVPPDPSLFSCQRCESILQLGYNCTVRIEKIKPNPKRRRKKHSLSIENSVVYRCHFCSHRNLKRGTPKGYMKELCPPKPKVSSKSDPTKSSHPKFAKAKVITASKNDPMPKVDGIASQEIINKDPVNNSPTTPSAKVGTLLDTRKRKRTRSGSKKIVESESSSVPIDAKKASIPSSKRKRKSWTSLKDIAERSEQDSSRNFTDLAIAFRV